MIIRNISSSPIVLDWASKLGIKLAPLEEAILDDALALTGGFKNVKDSNTIEVVSWDTSSYSTVVQDEMHIAINEVGVDVTTLESRVVTNEGNVLVNSTNISSNANGIATNLASINQIEANTIPIFNFAVDGLLYIIGGLATYILPRNLSITGNFKLYREVAGTGGSMIVDVKDQMGVSIFVTKPEVLASLGNNAIISGVVSKVVYLKDDILKLYIDQVEDGEPCNMILEVY